MDKKFKSMTIGEFFDSLRESLETVRDTIMEAIEAEKNPLDLEEFKKLIENWNFKDSITHYYKDDLEPITIYLRSQFHFISHDFYPGDEELNKCPSDEWVFYNNDNVTFHFKACPKHKTFILYVGGSEK